jgi:protein TonB
LTFLERHDRRQREVPPSDQESRTFEAWPIQGNVVPFAFDKAASGNRRAPGRAPVEMTKVPVLPKAPKRESRKILIATIIVSGAVHAAAIASVMSGDAGEQFGMLSSKVDTFSLATSQSIVLESISSHDVDMASAASADSQAGSVQSAESAPQELTEVKETPLTDEPPPKPIKVSDVTPSALSPTDEPLPVLRGGGEPDAASAIKAEEISERPVEEMPEETKEDAAAKAKREKKVEKERKIKQAQAHEQVAGSSASRSTTAHAASTGAFPQALEML